MSYYPYKAFKRDSCRVAFLACGEFCGESGLRKVGLHTCCNGFNCTNSDLI
ncbi:DUF3265 domain-containing protein [Vibrio vulnificus]|nr:DUF3265 domain-containing protein [Vibrio vulnificus]MCA3983762.1 DUF3265 domain-containing protein [Vibrio vulnificus]MCU8391011.1 DUF3265 domain-containing protein [Vibrio vulnificus]